MRITIAASVLAVALTGCATIFEGGTQPVTLKSVPDGAAITVTNRAGERIHAGVTPVTLTLKRGAGYFKSEEYLVSVKKDGYQPHELKIVSTVNGWYVANILFGGLIGMLAVDPATGAMYSFPEAVNATLQQMPDKAAAAERGLTIVSTEALSPEVMSQARLLGASR